MQINTTRFGKVEVDPEDILLFPNGLLGFEDCQHWVLLADADSDAVGWLQSISHPHIAMAAVSPRRYVRGYHLRVTKAELTPLQLRQADKAYVLALLANNDGSLTANLKAPVVINLPRRLGCQVVTCDEQPLQYELVRKPLRLRKSA